jgi:phosphoglycerol transferase MdoB-like AlkP superfamily enzyme
MKFVSDAVITAYLKIKMFFLATMFFHRLAFLIWYGESGLVPRSWPELLKAFWVGLRFDASVLVYANSLPLLVYLAVRVLPKAGPWTLWKRFAIGYWTLTFVVIQVLAILDFFYYMHFQDRLNVVMVGFFTDDTRALVSTIWKNYPIVWGTLAVILLGVAGYRAIKAWIEPLTLPASTKPLKLAAGTFAVLLASVVAGRGSFTFYPLGLIHTQVSTDPFVNLATVNAPFRIKTALKQYFESRRYVRGNIKAYGFEGHRAEAFELVFGREARADESELPIRSSRALLRHKPHMVVVLMESMGSYWFRYESPEFDLVGPLREQLKEAAFTLRMVPGHIGTIGSLASVLSGVPHGTRSAILSESPYQNLQMPTSPALFFNAAGYNTRFVYGGNLGWRGIGDFARRQGFKAADGEVEIERALGRLNGATHDWGVFDDRLFDYVLHVLETADRPEFIVVMTTSNHPPFEVPKSYAPPALAIPEELKGRLLVDEPLAHARFVAARFANDSIAAFRARLKENGLAGKSVLAMTGDHGFWFARLPAEQVALKYMVPFALWLPDEKLTLKARERMSSGFLSHLHILPSLYDLQADPGSVPGFLPSIFSDDDLVGYSSQGFALFPESVVTLDLNPRARCYRDLNEPLVSTQPCDNARPAAEEKYRAYQSAIDFYLESLKSSR